ncbi:Stress response protein nst1 [Kalmusia sp. IMI 367209]|nr:Stress response protein nst1 [Kalmusia sp. IMI 367209]
MAQGTRAAAAPTAPSPNGAAGTHAPAAGGVNRKKQKRREKEAAKRAAEQQKQHAVPAKNGVPHPAQPSVARNPPPSHQPAPQYEDPDYEDGTPYDDDEDIYSNEAEDGDSYDPEYTTNGHYQPGYLQGSVAGETGKKAKRKKKALPPPAQPAYHQPSLRPGHVRKPNAKNNRIWNTSTQEERERIREFWLSLGESERKSLVKIEKEAVLRKMKEQQKHSCSCTVCGRKRNAIEEELEVLYDAYYEELEQYATHNEHAGNLFSHANYGFASRAPRPIMTTHPPPGHYDDTDDFSGDEEEGDQDYSNSEISSDDDYSEEERSLPPPETADFLRFGNSLQVKGIGSVMSLLRERLMHSPGGILTVADDLLKNDGKKFIEMMEQLAERRMQREEEAQYSAHPTMYRSQHNSHVHQPQPEEDEFDDEEEDEEGYEDGDYEDDEEDEEDTMTEEQRMEEGRRMFQIFAARMFEQRVLQAYREKVAAERQQQLLQELAEEDDKKEAKEAKKAKEAAKRKEKKEKQRQQKLEEKARKDAEQAAKEAELKAAEEKRQEEQRRKREEQRKKREAERKAQEEEKQRKEAERLKRQHDERERQQEAERKAREHKMQEKKAREEAKRKEREEREAKEKDAREKKAQEEKERRDRDAKARAERERTRKEEQATATAQNAAIPKKNSQPVAVALPPQLLKQTSSTGIPSPHVTPAVPKAPTPSRPRQSSQQGSHGSSPKPSHVAPGTSKSMSPASQAQIPIMPKSILTKPPTSQQPTPAPHTQPTSPMPPIGPPPGMPMPPSMGMGNMPPGLNGFPSQGSIIPGMMGPGGRNMPMFPPQPSAPGFRGFPPPGMHTPSPMPIGRGFPVDAPPPGFGPMQGFPGPTHPPGFGMGMPTSHSRQTSGSFDKQTTESPIAPPASHPIQRPAPIQRPSSVKPHDDDASHNDVDDLANHLGSKALLDDEEDLDDFPTGRRTSTQPHGSLRGVPLFPFADAPGPPRPDIHGPFAGSSNASVWGTPPMPSMPFAPLPGSGWGNSPTASMFNNPFSMMGQQRPNEQRGAGEQRLVWLRRIVCSTCKMLSMRQSGLDGYVDAQEVHNHIESARAPTEPAVGLQEIKEACDIIGDNNNGGGSLEYKESPPSRLSQIKFVDAGGPPPPLGEIGSPIPSHSVPVGGGFGAGRPFPGLGPQGF